MDASTIVIDRWQLGESAAGPPALTLTNATREQYSLDYTNSQNSGFSSTRYGGNKVNGLAIRGQDVWAHFPVLTTYRNQISINGTRLDVIDCNNATARIRFIVNGINTADADFNGAPNSQSWDTALSCLLYTSPSPRDQRGSRMPSSA